jgi:ribosomal protein L30E
MGRRKISDVLWMAFECAKQDRASLIVAYSNDRAEPAVKDALKDIAAIERLQIKLFGTKKTELGAALEKGVSVDILDSKNIKKFFDDKI